MSWNADIRCIFFYDGRNKCKSVVRVSFPKDENEYLVITGIIVVPLKIRKRNYICVRPMSPVIRSNQAKIHRIGFRKEVLKVGTCAIE